jgi:hypothetical protein
MLGASNRILDGSKRNQADRRAAGSTAVRSAEHAGCSRRRRLHHHGRIELGERAAIEQDVAVDHNHGNVCRSCRKDDMRRDLFPIVIEQGLKMRRAEADAN